MDAGGTQDGVAVGADLALPRPVAGLVGEAQIEALILGRIAAQRLEAGSLDAQAQVVVGAAIAPVQIGAELDDVGVVGVGRGEDVQAHGVGGQEAGGGGVGVGDAGGLLGGLGLGVGQAGQSDRERGGGPCKDGGQADHLVSHFFLMPSNSAP
ncbi:hypothetical protein D3C81_1268280 [compost metagenome]